VPNIAHILQFTLCERRFRSNTMHLQLHIFRRQYSSERICAAIGDISATQCPLYCKHGAKYNAHPPDYAIWIVVPDIYNAYTVPHILASIFKWTYLRSYSRCIENSTRVIPQAWCQIQSTCSRLCYLDCGPGHIQCKYSSAYSGFNIQLNVSLPLLEISSQFNEHYTANIVPNTAYNHQLTQCKLWSRPYTV
jgi:hypothetical protein